MTTRKTKAETFKDKFKKAGKDRNRPGMVTKPIKPKRKQKDG